MKAIDWTDFHAVGVFTLDAAFGNNKGHGVPLSRTWTARIIAARWTQPNSSNRHPTATVADTGFPMLAVD